MKKLVIVYFSKTGFTERYAKWIAAEMECDCIALKNASAKKLSEYDIVIFGTRMFAGKMQNLNKAKKLFHKSKAGNLILFATGAAPNAAKDTVEKYWSDNLSPREIETIPHFYMQSGLNYFDMGFMETKMMEGLSKILSKQKNLSEKDQAFAEAIENSFDSSDDLYALPLILYVLEHFYYNET